MQQPVNVMKHGSGIFRRCSILLLILVCGCASPSAVPFRIAEEPVLGAEPVVTSSLFGSVEVVAGPPRDGDGIVGDFKPGTLVAADFDGDGISDLAVSNSFDGRVTVFRGHALRGYEFSCSVSVPPRPIGIVYGNFNADLFPDLVVTSYNHRGVALLEGDGQGCFSFAGIIPTGNSPQSLASADWNGDGLSDLAVSNRNSNSVSVILQKPEEMLLDLPADQIESFSVGLFPSGLVSGDWNGDGSADIAIVNHYSHSISVLLNTGEGNFVKAEDVPVGLYPGAIASSDFDMDGHADLAVANVRAGDVSILFGSGDGRFIEGARLPAGPAPAGIAVADFVGNGVPHIAVSLRDAPKVIVYQNDISTRSGFSLREVLTLSQPAIDLVAPDIHGDGAADLVLFVPSDNKVVAYRNAANAGSTSYRSLNAD